MKTLGKGIQYEVEKDVLVLRISLKQDFGPSKSGKTTIIATTGSNKTIEGTDASLNLSLYR